MKKILLLLSLFAFVNFSSCDKAKIDKDDYDKKDYDKKDWDDKDDDKKNCFELVYPVTYTMPDASEVTGNNEKEVWTAMKAWYEDHPDSAEKPALQYPVQVTFEEKDVLITIANKEEMIDLKKDCYDDDKEPCFELVYPVTYTLPDGSTATGGKEEVWTAIKAWYEDHPDSAEKPVLQYPVQIAFEDKDELLTVANVEEMIDLKKDCYNDDKKPCFEFLYPITFNMPDGSIITGGKEEVWAAIDAWYEAHPDSAEKPALVYPVQIAYEDNDELVNIANEEEMILAKEDCHVDDGE